MKIEVLISTMMRENIDFLNKMNLQLDGVVINQCDKKGIQYYKGINENNIKFISCKDRGLSNSRNKAIEHSTADICIIADDDVKYVDDLESIIKNAYNKYPSADIIVFKIRDSSGRLYKNYSNKAKKLGALDILKVSSVEMTFKRSSIINKVSFDKRFGAGSIYTSGEENIFLNQCIKNKLNIIYVPEVIAELQDSSSSWFTGYNDEYFKTKGAVFYKLSKVWCDLLIIQFAIRKYKIYKNDMSLIGSIINMMYGKYNIKRNEKNNEDINSRRFQRKYRSSYSKQKYNI